jgi:hypothetical protein
MMTNLLAFQMMIQLLRQLSFFLPKEMGSGIIMAECIKENE